MLRSDIEYIIHCESDGTIIWPLSKIHAHTSGARESLCHYSTWSMVFNIDLQKYWLQRKNPNKYDKNSAWKRDMGVAWHNCYELQNDVYVPIMFEDNLIKEAQEEIWIELRMFDTENAFIAWLNDLKWSIGFIFEQFHYQTNSNNEFVWLWFIATTETELEFTDDEVVEFKWLWPDEMESFLKTEPNICGALWLVFEKAEKVRKKLF